MTRLTHKVAAFPAFSWLLKNVETDYALEKALEVLFSVGGSFNGDVVVRLGHEVLSLFLFMVQLNHLKNLILRLMAAKVWFLNFNALLKGSKDVCDLFLSFGVVW